MVAPVFNGLDNNPLFTENGAVVVLDNNATVTDADLSPSSAIDGATLTLVRTTGSSPDDLFDSTLFDEGQVIARGLIVGFFTNSAGTLSITFNSDAVFGDVSTVIQSLTYQNASASPPPSVTIGYQFNDGDIATGSITVGITSVNNPPTIDGATLAFYNPGSSGVLLSPGIVVADADNTTLASASVTINQHAATDLLTASVAGTGISASYSVANGVLTLTGSASVATYQQVLESVTYSSSAADPASNGVPRTVTWQVSDGTDTASIGSSLDFFPAVDLDQSGAGTGFSTTFTQGSGAVAIADTDDVITSTATGIASATITLTNPKNGDTLSASGVPSHVTIDTSVPNQITLGSDGLASTADFRTALQHVFFDNANSVVNPATRDVTVVVQDLNNTSNAAHATITVSAVNHPGSATDDSTSTAEDTVLNVAAPGVLGNDNDPDGLVVITGSAATSQGGAIQFASDGSYTYTPAANFNGSDSVGYAAQDPFGSQVSATLTITVNAVNDAPVVSGSVTLASIAEDSGARLITQAQLLGNASDVDGPSLTAVNLTIATGAGALVNNNNGTWSYTPAPNDDTSVSFSYQVTDGVAAPVADSATLDITAVNDAPVVSGAVTLAAITEDSGARLITQTQLLGNASDVDGPSLAAVNLAITTGAGALVNNNNGTWSYTPAPNDDTSVSFSYQVTDSVAAPVADSASLDITPVNDAPVVSGSVTLVPVAEDSGARLITQVDLLGNASDVDGPSLTAINLAIASGVGTLVNNNNGTWSYTPALHDDTSVSFAYQVTDGIAVPVADTATLDITPTPPPPTGPTFTGTPGNDSFTALTGNERIDAGGGIDTITFGFRLIDATVTYSGNQVIVDSASSHTVLTGFETYVFTDGTVNNNDSDPLVDDLFYYSHYHDVWNAHADADAHFHTLGWHEGRDPDAFFSTSTYLSANPDVKAAGTDPLIHFDQFGWKEGRVPSINFDPRQYLSANPDVAAAHVDPLKHFLQFGAQEGRQPFAPTELIAANGFDYVYYLQHNPDVAAAHVDPFQHFETVGWKEGRNPNALFDTNGYLAAYPDVAAAHVNPLDHYDQFGWHEGRDPSVNFDTAHYLAAYPDVAAAHIDPLEHFLAFGIHEGRSAFPDGHFG